MGHALADLVVGRNTRIALDAFAPGRFAGVPRISPARVDLPT
jgi:hypothetical protein